MAAGCGGSSTSTTSAAQANPASVPGRVCGQAKTTAASVLGAAVTVRIADRDPTNVECVLRSGGVRIDLVAEQSPQAYTQFNTTESHQEQVYGPAAPGVHNPGEIPKDASEGPMIAGWIPAERQLFATNASPTTGGSYMTVTVRRGAKSDAERRKLARAVALATLAVAPRGPNPGGS
ncbi:MAG TPA: hypothetical protein VGN29_06850 [Solirubrobacteraceae bacterium]|nr:hypothetical protein [Solirubrobacteraceae bacterium]